MPSPFPGMDPYIERREIFPDFHDRFITYLCAALTPLLRPRYVALTADRLYVVEAARAIYPDVAVVKPRRERGAGAAALAEVDRPAVFGLETVREPYIQIVEPAAKNRVVTAIEVLSPENKEAGQGRVSYLQKRGEFWEAGANLVEVDLLRAGEPTVQTPIEKLESLRPWHYLVVVTRRHPPQEEVYAVPLQNRLPRIAVPLENEVADVPLDLQAVFTRCWDEGPYPDLLNYDGPPPGKLKAEEVKWCVKQLRAAGARNGR